MIFLAAIIGAITNRIRGGALTNLLWRLRLVRNGDESFIKPFSKNLNDFIFAAIFSFILDIDLDWHGAWCFASLFTGMRLGRSFGWGVYIDDMVNKKVSQRSEIFFIDYLFLRRIDHPLLRNAAALSTRGLMWTLSLAISFYPFCENALWIILIGLFMSPCYLLAMDICEFFDSSKRGSGWALGEVIWGFALWGSCAEIILGL